MKIICKIKQYLNYLSNILATRIIFSSQLKNFHEKLYSKEKRSKTATDERFSKISNRQKISNKQLHNCEASNIL